MCVCAIYRVAGSYIYSSRLWQDKSPLAAQLLAPATGWPVAYIFICSWPVAATGQPVAGASSWPASILAGQLVALVPC